MMDQMKTNLQTSEPSINPSISTQGPQVSSNLNITPAVITLNFDAPDTTIETNLSFREIELNGVIQKSQGGAVDDVRVNGTSVVSNGIADVNVPTKTSDLQNNSGFITSETDPTVPAWAKAQTKPTYTASEVGAQAAPLVGQIDDDTADDYVTPTQVVTAIMNQQQIMIRMTYMTTSIIFTAWTMGITLMGNGIVTSHFFSNTLLGELVGDVSTEKWTAGLYFLVTDSELGIYITGNDVPTYETDPTVPSWAKESSKPTYTASEVGALPDSTPIPSSTSQLQNDSGFITLNDLPIWDGGVI